MCAMPQFSNRGSDTDRSADEQVGPAVARERVRAGGARQHVGTGASRERFDAGELVAVMVIGVGGLAVASGARFAYG
jgi:hypothetical protein